MLSRKAASKQFWEFGFTEDLIDTDKSKTGALAQLLEEFRKSLKLNGVTKYK